MSLFSHTFNVWLILEIQTETFNYENYSRFYPKDWEGNISFFGYSNYSTNYSNTKENKLYGVLMGLAQGAKNILIHFLKVFPYSPMKFVPSSKRTFVYSEVMDTLMN